MRLGWGPPENDASSPHELDLDTLTAGGELVTIEEFTEAANDAGLDKDIMEDCLEELRVLWQEREEEAA